MIDQQILQLAAAAMFFMGLAGLATTRNLVKAIMSFQVVLFGVNLALFSSGLSPNGPSMFSTALLVLSISIGASVEAFALSLVILVYRHYGTLNPWEIRRLRH
jgi:multisubunit Na+/H+ antiporter MnhC subunit